MSVGDGVHTKARVRTGPLAIEPGRRPGVQVHQVRLRVLDREAALVVAKAGPDRVAGAVVTREGPAYEVFCVKKTLKWVRFGSFLEGGTKP
jgi:hypothetical protein